MLPESSVGHGDRLTDRHPADHAAQSTSPATITGIFSLPNK